MWKKFGKCEQYWRHTNSPPEDGEEGKRGFLPPAISEQMKIHPLWCHIPHFYRPLEQHSALLHIWITSTIRTTKTRPNDNRIKMKLIIYIRNTELHKLFDKFKLAKLKHQLTKPVFSPCKQLLFLFCRICKCNILQTTALME